MNQLKIFLLLLQNREKSNSYKPLKMEWTGELLYVLALLKTVELSMLELLR